MRTEEEVKEGIRHLQEAARSKLGRANPEKVAELLAIIDALRWTLGDSRSRFQDDVIEPCRLVERATEHFLKEYKPDA